MYFFQSIHFWTNVRVVTLDKIKMRKKWREMSVPNWSYWNNCLYPTLSGENLTNEQFWQDFGLWREIYFLSKPSVLYISFLEVATRIFPPSWKRFWKRRQGSKINHINRKSNRFLNQVFFYHLSSIIYYLSSIIYHLSSIIYHLSSIIYHLSSIIYHLSSISIIYHLSSIIYHLSSII